MHEAWVFFYDSETKQQPIEWRHSGSSKPKKVLTSSYWDCQVVIMIDFLVEIRRVTENYYSTILTTLRGKFMLRRKVIQ